MAIGGMTGIPASAAAQQPQFTSLRAEFLPGERTIFYDDFTDMSAGAAPSHFRTRGASPELGAAGALRQLTYTSSGSLFPNLTALPRNFTYEAEVKLDVPQGVARIYLVLYSNEREAAAWYFFVRTASAEMMLTRKLPRPEELGRTQVTMDLSQPVKLALWIQDGRVRAFVNGEKRLDVNQVELPPIDRVEMRTDLAGAGLSVGYRSVRFAESAPDFSQVISASGRYVSHGIRFATDSDQLTPESAPAVRIVASGLGANPDLRLLIEGHTDAVGEAAHNLDLSRRRAEAVKTVLTTQFNVDASRLTTIGLGSAKPIEPNDTPQGRAQNRRVEFVRQ
jgi:outer membrane protein OmpA-like peptidoglycan-associated protein